MVIVDCTPAVALDRGFTPFLNRLLRLLSEISSDTGKNPVCQNFTTWNTRCWVEKLLAEEEELWVFNPAEAVSHPSWVFNVSCWSVDHSEGV